MMKGLRLVLPLVLIVLIHVPAGEAGLQDLWNWLNPNIEHLDQPAASAASLPNRAWQDSPLPPDQSYDAGSSSASVPSPAMPAPHNGKDGNDLTSQSHADLPPMDSRTITPLSLSTKKYLLPLAEEIEARVIALTEPQYSADIDDGARKLQMKFGEIQFGLELKGARLYSLMSLNDAARHISTAREMLHPIAWKLLSGQELHRQVMDFRFFRQEAVDNVNRVRCLLASYETLDDKLQASTLQMNWVQQGEVRDLVALLRSLFPAGWTMDSVEELQKARLPDFRKKYRAVDELEKELSEHFASGQFDEASRLGTKLKHALEEPPLAYQTKFRPADRTPALKTAQKDLDGARRALEKIERGKLDLRDGLEQYSSKMESFDTAMQGYARFLDYLEWKFPRFTNDLQKARRALIATCTQDYRALRNQESSTHKERARFGEDR